MFKPQFPVSLRTVCSELPIDAALTEHADLTFSK